jgi:hypothetical protein
MTQHFYRFVRFMRSICAPFTAVVGFSCLLTFIFILYQPTPGPGAHQRLGWQSWDLITTTKDTSQVPTNEQAVPPKVSDPTLEGVDWWNVTNSDDQKVDSASLPLDVWAPLLPHDTGRALFVIYAVYVSHIYRLCSL